MKNQDNFLLEIPPDLIKAQKLAYEPSGLIASNFIQEVESSEYGAFDFEINHRLVKFRVAKITPTKVGQFVTLWKRIGKGPILPFDENDPMDLFVISVRYKDLLGQFVFPKNILCERGVVSKENHFGKRAMRVYPPWDLVESRQAKNTQLWQLPYFFEIPLHGFVNREHIKQLFDP